VQSAPTLRAKRESSIASAVELPPAGCYVDGDGARVVQVFANALNNAVKFTPRGGHIWFTAECRSDEAVVRIRDEVIAANVGAVPPSRLDALGTVAQHPWPRFHDRGERLRLGQEPDGARGIGKRACLRSAALFGGCELRPMIGVRREADQRVLTEARAQAIDERHLDAIGVVAGQESEVASCERRGFIAAQDHRFDRCGQRHARQALAQNAHEMRRHARRRAEREGYFRGRHAAYAQVALVIEQERQAHRAEPAKVDAVRARNGTAARRLRREGRFDLRKIIQRRHQIRPRGALQFACIQRHKRRRNIPSAETCRGHQDFLVRSIVGIGCGATVRACDTRFLLR